MILVLLLVAPVTDTSQLPVRANTVGQPRLDTRSVAEGLVSTAMAGDFIPSIEMKEDSEFLVVPALIVQEAVSENVILTFPVE